MQKLENKTLQEFLDRFIAEFKRWENEFDYSIPFVVSTLYQSFERNAEDFNEFIKDLEYYSDYVITLDKPQNDYSGIVDVRIVLYSGDEFEDGCCDYTYAGYDYKLCFSHEERFWGYCECKPDMADYREDKHCCGHGCDALFCGFSLQKIVNITYKHWVGDEHDYWDFEDEFYADDKELADKKAEEEKARLIKELKDTIEDATKKLAELGVV